MATYTYDIRAVCDTGSAPASSEFPSDDDAREAAAGGDPLAATMTSVATLRLTGPSTQNVHSYEVGRGGRGVWFFFGGGGASPGAASERSAF